MEGVTTEGRAAPMSVTVVDIDMPFGFMVAFMVKWAIATIPALLLLLMLAGFIFAIVGGIG